MLFHNQYFFCSACLRIFALKWCIIEDMFFSFLPNRLILIIKMHMLHFIEERKLCAKIIINHAKGT